MAHALSLHCYWYFPLHFDLSEHLHFTTISFSTEHSFKFRLLFLRLSVCLSRSLAPSLPHKNRFLAFLLTGILNTVMSSEFERIKGETILENVCRSKKKKEDDPRRFSNDRSSIHPLFYDFVFKPIDTQ